VLEVRSGGDVHGGGVVLFDVDEDAVLGRDVTAGAGGDIPRRRGREVGKGRGLKSRNEARGLGAMCGGKARAEHEEGGRERTLAGGYGRGEGLMPTDLPPAPIAAAFVAAAAFIPAAAALLLVLLT
jgi:hypothetical protein